MCIHQVVIKQFDIFVCLYNYVIQKYITLEKTYWFYDMGGIESCSS